MKRFESYKAIELTANIFIVILAIVLTVFLAKKLLISSIELPPERIQAGEIMDELNVNQIEDEKTIFVALQPDCHFCSESAPLYRKIQQLTLNNRKLHFVALFPSETENEKDYLEKLDVDFDEIKKVSFDSIKIAGTPTILIVEKGGMVKSVWNGKLQPSKETSFIKQLDENY